MSDLTLTFDFSEVKEKYAHLASELDAKLAEAVHGLAIQAHAHITEQASSKLHTRRQAFLDSLSLVQMNQRVWAVTVSQEGLWIEEGMEPHSMLDSLLSSPKAKTAKDGSKYIVVPFKHDKGPTQQTPHARQLLQAIKKELKSRKIPYKGIERNPDGSPKKGLLHKMDLHGPQHSVPPTGAQGPGGKPFSTHSPHHGTEGPAGRPYLWGLRIYQHGKTDKNGAPLMGKDGHQQMSRSIMTFRVASSKQQGKWFHPGTAPMRFLDEAHQWAKDQFDNEIAPAILKGLGIA